MIDPEAEIAAAITGTGRVGVLATPATVEGGAYHRALGRIRAGARGDRGIGSRSRADHPERLPFDQSVVDKVRSYCAPLKAADVDTLILGCTHYPLVAPMLQRILGRDVRLVTAGHAIAATAQRMLESSRARVGERGGGRVPVPLHRRRGKLPELGTRFLQMPLGEVEHV